jgi:hypothetical protein
MFCRACGEATDLDEERWHHAMRFLMEHVPASIVVTVLIAKTDGSGHVVTCDCCENCAAEMVLGAARDVEEPDGDQRPRFSSAPEPPAHYDA